MSRVRNLVDFNFRTSDFDGDTDDDVVFNNLTVNGTFAISNAGNTTFTAGGNLTLDATNRVIVQDTPLKLASMTTTVRDALASALDGDLIYNTSTHKLNLRENGSWAEFATGGINNLLEDTSPQLGGNLDVNGKAIVSTSNGDIEVTPNGSGDIHLETQTGMLRINRASGGTGVNLGSHNMYLNSDSFTTGTSVSIGLQPGTDTGPTTNTFGFLRMTRESNTSGEFSIHVAEESSPAGTYYVTQFGGAADYGSVDFPTSIGTKSIIEHVLIETTTSGTYDFNFVGRSVAYFTTNQTANRTLNFTWSSTVDLNSVMQQGESITAAALFTQGATPYYINVYQVDGSAVTPEWQGGSAPTAGNANSIDVYSFTIIKTGNASFKCLASQTQYA